MISKKDIEHLAKLARIDVSEAEKEKLAQDLQAVLAYVKTLQEADVGDESFTHFEHLETRLREDAKENDLAEARRTQQLLASAPVQEKGYVTVKNVLGK
ncbi:MAG: Asp-tRNA(Asn)/Glu-tRNA(Gln) amidotransferase subunit GatC [bacterium]|nr:Asp-tRNA(Asn)/Glu-tRNA(Gln) amidotransferase subunit GatC [bacterium]